MCSFYFKFVVFFLCFSLLSVSASSALASRQEQHRMVSLRMIGHQVLLNFGDSTSRVLPIKKVERGYKIEFEKDFAFNPDSLVKTINEVVLRNEIANGYYVEVVECQNEEVVYNFEINFLEVVSTIPCGQRDQAKGCYTLYLSFFDDTEKVEVALTSKSESVAKIDVKANTYVHLFWVLPIIFVIGLAIYWLLKIKSPKKDVNVVLIGKIQFNKVNAELIINNEKTELSSKESELLLLLHNNKNSTVERDIILSKVWDDEGAYVGRTLDVFISKLRKKLEPDESVKIINIRGVGYKLAVDDVN